MAVRASDGQAATCALTWLIAAAPSPSWSSSTRRPFAQALSPASAGSAGRGVDGVESVSIVVGAAGAVARRLWSFAAFSAPEGEEWRCFGPGIFFFFGAAERAALW